MELVHVSWLREDVIWCEMSAMNCMEPVLEPLHESAASDQR